MSVRIKFCGLTREADVREAAAIGAGLLGFIFAHASPRRLTLAQFDRLIDAVPLWVTPVALFRDNMADEVASVLARSPRLCAQFHGDETPGFCAQFKRAWLKAVPMGALPDADLAGFLTAFANEGCSGFVFDSHGGTAGGGSGRGFDWSRIPREVPGPAILAGGLSPDNVADAIKRVRPVAVDVSSGIETAPGIKDHAKMRRFADEVFRVRFD